MTSSMDDSDDEFDQLAPPDNELDKVHYLWGREINCSRCVSILHVYTWSILTCPNRELLCLCLRTWCPGISALPGGEVC